MLPYMSATLFLKLMPPRPTFATDMTSGERAPMQQHVAYMGELFEAGKVLVYGPVMAADGSFGMAVLDVGNEGEARSIMDNDPTVKAELNAYELSPMIIGNAQARRG